MRARWLTRSVLLSALVLVTACVPEFGTPIGVADLRIAAMSVDGTDSYVYTPDATGLSIAAAPGNTGAETRQVYWDTKTWYRDLEACQTWDSIPDVSTPEKLANPVGEVWQPGVALRIAPTPSGDQVRALVTNLNIWALAYWSVQVNFWQTTPTGQLNITAINAFDMSAVLGSLLVGDGTLAAPPWHLCSRVVADQLTFKIWTGDDPEPAWDDPVHARTVTLPPEDVYSGYAGGYVGHIKPGFTEHVSGFRSAVIPIPSG